MELNLRKVLTNPDLYPTEFILFNYILFALLGNAISNLVLDKIGDYLNKAINLNTVVWHFVVITIIFIPISLGITNFSKWFRSLRQKEKTAKLESNVTLAPTYKGLIVFLSKLNPDSKSIAELSILHHWANRRGKLSDCWLICSEESVNSIPTIMNNLISSDPTLFIEVHNTKNSKDVYKVYQGLDAANRRIKLYCSDNYKLNGNISLLLENAKADDPNYSRELINSIYIDAEEKGIDQSDIIADLTSGFKPFTVGVVLACAKPGRRLQYFSQILKKKSNPKESEIMEIKIDYKNRPTR